MNRLARIALGALLTIACQRAAAAATLIVPTDYATIQSAIDAAAPGDVVLVRSGTYAESITFREGVRLVGESRDGTVLTLPTADDYSVIAASGVTSGSVENLTVQWDLTGALTAAFAFEAGSAIDLLDVTVRGFSVGALYRADPALPLPPRMPIVHGCVFEGNQYGVWVWNGMSPTIRQNAFLDGYIGISMRNWSNPEIDDNDVSGMAWASVDVWEGSQPYIHDNRITGGIWGVLHAWWSHSTLYRNVVEGAQIGIYAVSYSSPVIQDNIVAKNAWDGMFLFLNWPRVYNNTIVENGGNGIDVLYYAWVDVRNNVIAFNGGWGTGWSGYWTYGQAYLSYNDSYGNALGNTGPNEILLDGNISQDPLFVDRAAGNYQLGWFSPAIDAGDPDPAFNDLDKTRNDMGAYGGPQAFPKQELPPPPTLSEAIFILPDFAFKNEAPNRREALQNKLNVVLAEIQAAEAETGGAREAALQGALGELQNDLLAKCDGWFGGQPADDWIVTQQAQQVVYPLVVKLIAEVRILLGP